MTLHAALNLYRLTLLSLVKEIKAGHLTTQVADEFLTRQYSFLLFELKTDRHTFEQICIKLDRNYFDLTE